MIDEKSSPSGEDVIFFVEPIKKNKYSENNMRSFYNLLLESGDNLDSYLRWSEKNSYRYGFLGSDNKIHQLTEYKNIVSFVNDYISIGVTQSIEQMKKNRTYAFFDMVELDRNYFKKNNIKHDVYLAHYNGAKSDLRLYIWFEHKKNGCVIEYALDGSITAFDVNEGEDKLEVITGMMMENKKSGILRIISYPQIKKYGLSTNDVMNFIAKNGRLDFIYQK